MGEGGKREGGRWAREGIEKGGGGRGWEKRRGAVGEGGNREEGRWAREGIEKGGGGRGRE